MSCLPGNLLLVTSLLLFSLSVEASNPCCTPTTPCCDPDTEECCANPSCPTQHSENAISPLNIPIDPSRDDPEIVNLCVPKGTCYCNFTVSRCCGDVCCPLHKTCLPGSQCIQEALEVGSWVLFGLLFFCGVCTCLLGCYCCCKFPDPSGEDLPFLNSIVEIDPVDDTCCLFFTPLARDSPCLSGRIFFIMAIFFKTSVYIMFLRQHLLFLVVLANLLKIAPYFMTRGLGFLFYILGVLFDVVFYCVPFTADICPGYSRNPTLYIAVAQATYLTALLSSLFEVPLYGTKKKFGCYWLFPGCFCLKEWKAVPGEEATYIEHRSSCSLLKENTDDSFNEKDYLAGRTMNFKDAEADLARNCCLISLPYFFLNLISISCALVMLIYFECFQ